MTTPSRWGWLVLPLLLIYGLTLIYFVFRLNPDLMHTESRRARLIQRAVGETAPVPRIEGPAKDAAAFTPGFMSAHSPQHTGIQDQTLRVGHRFRQEDDAAAVNWPLGSDETLEWWMDSDGVFVSHDGAAALSSLDFQGQKRWTFRFHENVVSAAPWITRESVFVPTRNGRLYALDRFTGRLRWLLPNLKPLAGLSARGDFLVITEQVTETSFRLRHVDPFTGRAKRQSETFTGTVKAPLSWPKTGDWAYVTTLQGQVLAIYTDTGKKKWQQELGGEIRGPVVVVDETVYVATGNATVAALHAKDGHKLWTYALSSGAEGPPVYIPAHELVAVLTDVGYLHAIDRRTGEGRWRFNTHNQSPSHRLAAVRLNANSMSHLELAWRLDGWTLWSPCAQDRLCVYNPSKGQLLARIPTRGSVDSRPLFRGQELLLGLRTVDATAEGKKLWRLASFVETTGQATTQTAERRPTSQRNSDAATVESAPGRN